MFLLLFLLPITYISCPSNIQSLIFACREWAGAIDNNNNNNNNNSNSNSN